MNHSGIYYPAQPMGIKNFKGEEMITPAFVLVEGCVMSGARVDVSYPDGTIMTHTVTRHGLGPDDLLGGRFASRCTIDTGTFEQRQKARLATGSMPRDEGDYDND